MASHQNGAEAGEEIALAGGRLTKGVVRIGETVRRPARDSSEFVARLLRHLETLQVAWAPRFLGRDERGRDVFTYMPGSVPERWQYFADVQVEAAAKLLRAFHDATRGSALCDGRSLVCHHDFGPNNAVFVNNEPCAMIDFDLAAPGDALEDLAYSAWAWCVSSKRSRPEVDVQAHQVAVMADSYGLESSERGALVDAIIERQERNARFWTGATKDPERVLTPLEKMSEIIEWSRREAAYVAANRERFEARLRGV